MAYACSSQKISFIITKNDIIRLDICLILYYFLKIWYNKVNMMKGWIIVRYIGSKTKMLETLKKEIIKFSNCQYGSVFCDIFSGTCGVGDYMQDIYSVIANDNLYFSYIIERISF